MGNDTIRDADLLAELEAARGAIGFEFRRIILMHLCSEAVRQKSATIDIADTFTGFVRDLGFPDSGGKKGPLTAFKEQLNALSACTMRMTDVSNASRSPHQSAIARIVLTPAVAGTPL